MYNHNYIFNTPTIKIIIIVWHFLDVIRTFNNSLISYSHV